MELLGDCYSRIGGSNSKEAVLDKEQAHSIQVDARRTQAKAQLAQTEDLHLANEKVKATEERAASITSRAVEEYKSKEFDNDTTKAGANSYAFGFTDCKNTVAQAYVELDLSGISAKGTMPREEEEEGIAEEETAWANEVVVEAPRLDVAASENPEESATVPKLET